MTRNQTRALPAFLTPLAALIIGLAAALAAALFRSGALALPLDDAYIHLVFARNLAEGNGFAFNPGETSLGFSSPLWVFFLALLSTLGTGLESAAKFAPIVFFGASAALVFIIVAASLKRTGAGEGWGLLFAALAALLLIACGNLLWLAGAGMESMLFLGLGLAAILAASGEKQNLWAAAALLSLALVTRIEALALYFILAPVLLARPEKRARAAMALAAALLPLLAWSIFSFTQTGHLLPPTRAGKLASNLFNAGFSLQGVYSFTIRHLYYLWKFDRGIAWLLLLCLPLGGALGYFALRDKKGGSASPAAILLGWAVINFFAHSLLFRPTAIVTPYHNLRYHPMLLPAVIAFAAYGLAALGARVTRPAQKSALAMAALVLLAPLTIEAVHLSRWRAFYMLEADQLRREHFLAAEYAKNRLPGDARVACLDIGMLGYFSGRYIIDLGGLIDPAIIPYLSRARTGEYLAQKRATHYFAMTQHDSERITGVKKDEGVLYRLYPLAAFSYPYFDQPVFLHSRGIEIYKLEILN